MVTFWGPFFLSPRVLSLVSQAFSGRSHDRITQVIAQLFLVFAPFPAARKAA